MTTVSDIRSRDWSPKLGAFGSVVENLADIEQCIRIISATRIGSVPLRRDFGSDIWKFLDKPFAVAQAGIPLALIEAMRWEPRVEVLRVNAVQRDGIERLHVEIEWRVRSSPQQSFFLVLTGTELAQSTAESAPVRLPMQIPQQQQPVESEPVTLPEEIPNIVEIYETARTT